MKTLTEFSGFTLKEAQTKKTALIAEGKTEEEVSAALQEQLKLDEAKIGFYKNVVDMTSSRMDRVKRVVVALKANDQEKVPESYIEREGHFYLVEYFPDANARHSTRGHSDREDRGGRGDRGRGRSGDRNERRPARGDRPERPARSPRPEGQPRPEGTFAQLKPGHKPEQKPRAPRPPRGDRPANAPKGPRSPQGPRAPRGPRGAGELRLVLKGESQTTLPGSGAGQPAAAPVAATTGEQPQA